MVWPATGFPVHQFEVCSGDSHPGNELGRAVRELQSLFAAQWSNGKIPHIVFNPDAPAGSYWPGPQHWACKVPDWAPAGCTAGTSGLCQPPVHAIAAARLWSIADRARSFLADAFGRLMAWHAYLSR